VVSGAIPSVAFARQHLVTDALGDAAEPDLPLIAAAGG
jgi:hypothetical protein